MELGIMFFSSGASRGEGGKYRLLLEAGPGRREP